MPSSIDSGASGNAEANPGSAFWLALRRIEKNKINGRWLALRNSLAVALPLGVGIALGNPLGAVAVTSGALNVSFSDGGDPYGQRARRMFVWSALGGLAVFIGSLAGAHPLAAVVVATLWAFMAGMLICISTRAGDLGLNTLVALIVFEARGVGTLKGAFYTGLLVLAGGLLQTAFALLFWPVRRSAPERLAIGQVYLDLSREVDPNSEASPSPLSAPSIQAQEALEALGRDHSVAAERFLLLFEQADRLRLSIYL
ncbi:MAG TPA: FUSC family membrane protein, partial [Bryobacteraceae bacterium]|nr:FUSC family membrane protein [Bryobacteraceae bacterium]